MKGLIHEFITKLGTNGVLYPLIWEVLSVGGASDKRWVGHRKIPNFRSTKSFLRTNPGVKGTILRNFKKISPK